MKKKILTSIVLFATLLIIGCSVKNNPSTSLTFPRLESKAFHTAVAEQQKKARGARH